MSSTSELTAHFKNALYEKYFPVDDKGKQTGKWFHEHLTAQDPSKVTTVFMNTSTIINDMATTGVAKPDQMNSIGNASMKYIEIVSILINELKADIPDKLAMMGWVLSSDPYQAFWDPLKFCGINPETSKPMFGAPACMIVLDLKPMEERIPISKPRLQYPKYNNSAPAPAPAKPQGGAMAAYRKSPEAPAPVPAPVARQTHKGKPRRPTEPAD